MKDFIKDNIWKILALSIAILLVTWLLGCESTVPSIADPQKRLSRDELRLEIDTLLAKAEIKFGQLDKQDQLRQLIIKQGFIIAESGTINPFGIATAIMSIFGIGSLVDDRKKTKELKIVKKELDYIKKPSS